MSDDKKKNNTGEKQGTDRSRRTFLRNSGIAVGGIVVGTGHECLPHVQSSNSRRAAEHRFSSCLSDIDLLACRDEADSPLEGFSCRR